MPCFRIFVLLILLGPVAAIGSPTGQYADLRVTVEGSVDSDGPVYFALYDDPHAFERQRDGIHMIVLKQWTDQPSVAFTDLAPGRYVVAVFQDLNGNGKLDTDFLGRPMEPYALSGRALSPRFEEAAINIDTDSKSISLELVRD